MAAKKNTPYFSIILSFWKREQEFMQWPQKPEFVKSDAALLKAILKDLNAEETADLAKISVMQSGGKAAPWIVEFMKDNPGHRGGFAWFFGGEYMLKRK